MKVKELISALRKQDPNGKLAVFTDSVQGLICEVDYEVSQRQCPVTGDPITYVFETLRPHPSMDPPRDIKDDARRYRLLWGNNWTLGGLLVTHRKYLRIGDQTYSGPALDEAIDKAWPHALRSRDAS